MQSDSYDIVLISFVNNYIFVHISITCDHLKLNKITYYRQYPDYRC